MPSERTQRLIGTFLDEAESAASKGDWQAVAEKARAVIAVDPENQDAPALLTGCPAAIALTARDRDSNE